jgi:hypothetical protein
MWLYISPHSAFVSRDSGCHYRPRGTVDEQREAIAAFEPQPDFISTIVATKRIIHSAQIAGSKHLQLTLQCLSSP